jgi:UDP:flavonoid glycosyltransferase YjiC (YdhE family)
MGSDHPSAGAVVRGLDRSGIAVAGYIPGPASAPTAFLEALGAELHESLPSQAEILSRTSIVVGGDVWLAQAAYASGRPQICLPTSLEARLLGARLQQLGCGIALRRFSAGELASAVRELMLDPVYRKRAEEEAHGVAEIPPEGESARIVARRCLELANR